MSHTNSQSDRPLIVIAFLGFIAMGLLAGLTGVAWPSMRLDFGVPLDAIGALMVLSMVVSLALSFSSGSLIAAVGLGPLLVIGAAVGALGFLGNALAPTWWSFILLAVVASAGVTIINTGLNTYFAMASTASLMNWLHASFGLGATISPILLTAVLSAGRSWRWGYVLVTLSLALLTLLLFLTRNRWPLPEPETTENPSPASAHLVFEGDSPGPSSSPLSGQAKTAPARRTSYKDSLKSLAVWMSLLLFFTFTGMEGTAGQWPYVLFTEGRGIDPVTAGLWVSIYWASMTAGRIVFGFLVRRIATKPLMRACGAVIVAGAALLWLNPGTILSFVGLMAIGFCVAPFFPVLASETPKLLGMANAANVIGFQITAVRLGLAILPAAVGVWAEATGLEVIGLSLFAIAVAIVVLYELLLRAESGMPEPRRT